jgi:F0F1-type ATP synthase epsilon subunit
MLFFLATAKYDNVQSNTTKVTVHLRNGVAQIFDKHQDLMGKVENNLIEIETDFENRLEKFAFVLQDAVFIVSNKGLDGKAENKGTSVYVYAKRVIEITPTMSLEEISKEYDAKTEELKAEKLKVELKKVEPSTKTNLSLIYNLNQDVKFLKRALKALKRLKS